MFVLRDLGYCWRGVGCVFAVRLVFSVVQEWSTCYLASAIPVVFAWLRICPSVSLNLAVSKFGWWLFCLLTVCASLWCPDGLI